MFFVLISKLFRIRNERDGDREKENKRKKSIFAQFKTTWCILDEFSQLEKLSVYTVVNGFYLCNFSFDYKSDIYWALWAKMLLLIRAAINWRLLLKTSYSNLLSSSYQFSLLQLSVLLQKNTTDCASKEYRVAIDNAVLNLLNVILIWFHCLRRRNIDDAIGLNNDFLTWHYLLTLLLHRFLSFIRLFCYMFGRLFVLKYLRNLRQSIYLML